LPTYSYRCADCDYAFDQYQAFTEDTLTNCPNCAKAQLRKVFSNIGVTFNGSGFYRNDSRSKTSTSESPTPAKEAAPKVEKAIPAPKKSEPGSATA